MKRRKKTLLSFSTILILFIMGFLLYYNKAFQETIDIADTIEKAGNDYVFHGDSKVGFIIFSGVKADERAYAYMAKLLHKEGHTVVIPKAPFHLNIAGTRHGVEIMESNPEIEKWIVIGHSLGGLPAGRIAAKQPDKILGVAFLASYMTTDLSKLNI